LKREYARELDGKMDIEAPPSPPGSTQAGSSSDGEADQARRQLENMQMSGGSPAQGAARREQALRLSRPRVVSDDEVPQVCEAKVALKDPDAEDEPEAKREERDDEVKEEPVNDRRECKLCGEDVPHDELHFSCGCSFHTDCLVGTEEQDNFDGSKIKRDEVIHCLGCGLQLRPRDLDRYKYLRSIHMGSKLTADEPQPKRARHVMPVLTLTRQKEEECWTIDELAELEAYLTANARSIVHRGKPNGYDFPALETATRRIREYEWDEASNPGMGGWVRANLYILDKEVLKYYRELERYQQSLSLRVARTVDMPLFVRNTLHKIGKNHSTVKVGPKPPRMSKK